MTPIAVIRSSAAMMPRLEAEESLLAAQRASVGSGTLKADDAKAIVRRWTEAARPDRRPQAADPGALAAIGIGVQAVTHG